MFSGFVLAAVAGCGGGGGSSGGPPPVGAPFAAIPSRPLASGDAFRYAGTTQQNFVYSAAAPSPASNTTYNVVQNVAVTGPTAFNGATNAFDFKTSETDTSPLQAIGITTDTYYGTSGSNYVTYGSATTDTNGESLNVALATPHIVDKLPELSGDSWTNDAALTLQERSPGGQTSQRSYAADGSYTDTTNYPQGSLYAQTPGTLTGTITQNADGSGRFVIEQNGSNVINAVSVGTPRPVAAGTPVIPIVVTQGGSAPTEADVPSWYPSPLTLYAETDMNAGGSALPAACNVPSVLARTGNVIVQTVQRVDTILGTLETIKTTDYVIPSDGVACVTVADTLNFYYDYSGQSPGLPAVSNKPIETETVSTTLGLTNATVQSAVRRDTSLSHAASFRVADARANLFALVEHEKTRHRQRLAAALARTLLERNAR